MTADLIAMIQAVVRDELRAFRTAELGVVTKVYAHESDGDLNNYACDVRLRDAELELKRVPVTTNRLGQVAIPNPDDLVLVQYLNGDVQSALITGRLYSGETRPPVAKPHEWVYISPDAAESGIHRFALELPNANKLHVKDDEFVLEMGKTKVTITHDGDVEIISPRKTITLRDENSANLVTIAAGQGQVTVQAQTKVVVQAAQIELVEGAGHPLVFGDSLLQYLNQIVAVFQAHLHVGEMALGTFPVTPAPPAAPMPTATPSLLSLKVKTG